MEPSSTTPVGRTGTRDERGRPRELRRQAQRPDKHGALSRWRSRRDEKYARSRVSPSSHGLGRIVVDDVRPRTPSGWPAKATSGEVVPVSADVFADGHDLLAARARVRPAGTAPWLVTSPLAEVGNDRYEGALAVPDDAPPGLYELVVEAWRDAYATWRRDVRVKAGPGQSVAGQPQEGPRPPGA